MYTFQCGHAFEEQVIASVTCPRCKGVTASTATKAAGDLVEPTAAELRSVLADLAEAMRQQGSAIGRLAEREPVAVVGEAKRGGFRILKTAEGVSVEETA